MSAENDDAILVIIVILLMVTASIDCTITMHRALHCIIFRIYSLLVRSMVLKLWRLQCLSFLSKCRLWVQAAWVRILISSLGKTRAIPGKAT